MTIIPSRISRRYVVKSQLTTLLLLAAIQIRAPLEPLVGGFVHGDDVLGYVWPLFSE